MLENSGHFKDNTILISGASRGIGLAIAKKLAADGANIVIAAKTAEPHPTLPGTIYTAAKEIEQAGGKCLPCVVDVRDEKQVDRVVQQTIERFGRLDILINNASAVNMSPTLKLDMKKYDLMHAVNVKGTFMLSQKCIPYLEKSPNPHILNISPPLVMESQWFAPHVAYTISKFSMSLCVLGMSEELKPKGIAVNALWPRAMISTAALRITKPDPEAERHSRKAEIMADAAYALLKRPAAKTTGRFALDEEILQEEGIDNFDAYAYDPSATLQLDLFLPGISYEELKKMTASKI